LVNGGFFGNISNTIQLMKSCVKVLRKDRELILFPIMAAIFVLLLLGLIYSTGSIDFSAANEEQQSIFPIAILIFGANFIIVFFNSALISAALKDCEERPKYFFSLSHALKHVHHIFFLWSIIVTIMGLIFAAIKANGRNRGGFGGMMTQIFASFLEAGWAMMTFFVVPIIVSENMSPISAIKRSSSLFKQTWGNQVAANFGFGIFQIIALLISLGIGWFFGLINGTFGIAIGLLCATASISIIYTLEGIYKAALYEHALGEKPLEFEEQDLRTAYRANSAIA